MLKQGNLYSVTIKLKPDKNFLNNLFTALSYNETSDKRVKTKIKMLADGINISIKANDFNILLAVNNSIMQSIKMLETVNKYE
jgi:tRNA threonylcarbamoyladenosine modification (KEOPS) complex  Pcc1 subunit